MKDADVFAALVFAAAVIVVLVSILALAGCAQPYTTESKTAASNPYCIIHCVVTQTSIEDNRADAFTPTVGTSVTGGSTSRTDTDTRTRTRTTGDRVPASALY